MDHAVGRIIFLVSFCLLPKTTPAHGRQTARTQRKIQQQAQSPKERKKQLQSQ
jgi:hypothetical protein